MNTYKKFCPNVFVAQCEEEYSKGDTIILTTKRGKEIECTVHNLVYQRDGYYYYSITRVNGFAYQSWVDRENYNRICLLLGLIQMSCDDLR